MSNMMSERAVASRLLQYHMDLIHVKENSSIQLASLTVIQEFLKNDKNGNIRQMFLDRGLLESLLMSIDSALDNLSELAFLDVGLKCLWFLSQLSIGPLQNIISHDVMRRLLYLLNVNGSIYHFTSKFSRNFQQLCESKHLIGKIQTKQMSSEIHYTVHKLSNHKLKYLDKLPDNVKICSLFDTSDSEKDVNITDHLLGNFRHSWPNKHEIQDKTGDTEEWEDIFVSEVIDGPLFWAHIGMSNIETVRDIQMALEAEDLQPTKCATGDDVVVKKILDSDRSFCMRARVIKVDQWKVKVWALDYGYEMDLPCNQIYMLPDKIGTNKHPPQISLCKLAGVEPPSRHKVIPQLAASILSNICQKSIPACEILVEQSGLEILETFLHVCPEPETIIYVLRLITNIAFHSKMSSSISNSNLTECILDRIAELPTSPLDAQNVLLVASLNCLCNILFRNDTTRDKFYHYEGINTVMKVLLQNASIKDEIYQAGTHLLRIFIRKIDTEPSMMLQRKRSLDRQHKSSTGRSSTKNKKHHDSILKKCPSEFAKFVQSHNITAENSRATTFQPRLYETAWSDDSDDNEDPHLVTHTQENTEDITRPVTTCDATHYYGQTMDKTFILGSEVEFENDTTHELRPNKSILKVSSAVIAKHVCGLLNSGKGGRIYFGIRNTIQGVELDRDDRDMFRIGVDRMMSEKITPCVLHSMFDVIYTPVVELDKHTDTFVFIKDRFVAEILIKPVANSITYTLKDGECFYRFGPHTSQLTALEMRQLIILEEEELYMEEFKQLSMELEQLNS